MRPSLFLGTAALALALPALAQDRPESILPPGFGDPAAPPPPVAAPAPAPRPSVPAPAPDRSPVDSQVAVSDRLTDEELAEIAKPAPPPPEYPGDARRDPMRAGVLDPRSIGLGEQPWGRANGKFLSILLRRMDTPLASRWAHIALRNALLVQGPPPGSVHPADWVAERAWLLVRMGEADAAQLLVDSLDTDKFTPKMVQVAAQVGLANSDPSALCAIEKPLARAERRIAPLVAAMCAALAGEAERAAADIESARRRGPVGGIDLALAAKVVGAAGDSARAAVIDWEPVQGLNSWRYGLASATGLLPPERLIEAAAPRLRAWMASAPIYGPLDRLKPARSAAALGVLSSDAYVDLYAAAFDATDPDALGESDAWRLRQAFVAREPEDRLAAMRHLWTRDGEDRAAAWVLTARAASLVTPSTEFEEDVPDLLAAMFAAGFDRQAARWAKVVAGMSGAEGDRAWAMLALGAPQTDGIEIDAGRIEDFADRDESPSKRRTALLVAGLAGLGRIDAETTGQLNRRYGLGLAATTRWTRLIDGASARRQAGTVAILAASGLQAPSFADVPGLYQFHGVTALRRVGLEFHARMIAAEALARS